MKTSKVVLIRSYLLINNSRRLLKISLKETIKLLKIIEANLELKKDHYN